MKVCDKEYSTKAIIGRPLLAIIWSSNNTILKSMADAKSVGINLSEAQHKSEFWPINYNIKDLFEAATYNSACSIADVGLEEDDVYLCIGVDSEEDLFSEIENRTK